MAEIWHLIIHSNIVNFLIVLALICWLFSKINLGQKIDGIRSEIKNFVDSSSDEKLNAEKDLEKIKEEITHLPEEIEEIQKSAKNSVESMGKKIESEIKSQMVDIENNAKRIMALETKKFKSKLTGVLTEASINLAQENAVKQLDNDRTLHDKYIYEAIEEIDKVNL